MRIGVLSDTHVRSVDDVPQQILAALDEVDLIVHSGDFVTKAVLDGLKQLGEVRAVRGNMDSEELKRLLPEKDLLTIEGKRIGIIHGWGAPFGIEDRVRGRFDDVDIIIFGHSHHARNKTKEGVLFFNPGRAQDSFGILTIDEEVRGEIIKL
jgi:putative phosphoesterase